MWVTETLLLTFGLVGHTILWVEIVNRVHAMALPRWLIGLITLTSFLVLGGVPLLLAITYSLHGTAVLLGGVHRLDLSLYLVTASAVAVAAAIARWLYGQQDGRGLALVSNHTRAIDVAAKLGRLPVGPGIPSLYARLPGNELFHLHVHHKQITLPRLPARLGGLKIAQVSDLHMSGRITRPFFEEVVKVTNDLHADLIVITGDLFDKQACFDWIDSTYALLSAPSGVYFIFGNHDQRVDTRLAIGLLEQAGLVHLGGRWELLTADHSPLILAGNELPWFPPPPELANCPAMVNGQRPFRLLLSHSPDQFMWARERDFDLVLAGHNHGGQIRLPGVGAVFAPSRFGTRYAMGTFQQGSTVMHVSRGTGTHSPVRYYCPPEITLLELVAADQS
jgi:predicted MPP superfamily phosphohydrolase